MASDVALPNFIQIKLKNKIHTLNSGNQNPNQVGTIKRNKKKDRQKTKTKNTNKREKKRTSIQIIKLPSNI